MLIVGAVLAVATVTVLCAEVWARRWIRSEGKYFVWRPHHKKVIELNPVYSPFLRKPIHISINAEGERGGELPKTAGKLYRVLVAGDSTAECITLDQDETWPAVLERILETNKSQIGVDAVHVGNIAKTLVAEGSGLRIILEKILPRYLDLDLIILTTGISTVYRWFEEGCPSGLPAPPTPVGQLFSQYPEMEFGRRPENTALAELAQRWLFRFTGYAGRNLGAGRVKIAIASQRSGVQEFYPLIENPAGMLDTFEQELRGVVALAKTKAPRIILVYPFWFQKDHFTAAEEAALWLGYVGKPNLKKKQWQFVSQKDLFKLYGRVEKRAAKVAQEMAVEAIDLKDFLDPRLGIYYDDCHLTPAGAALAAQKIAALVLRGQQPHNPNATQ